MITAVIAAESAFEKIREIYIPFQTYMVSYQSVRYDSMGNTL